MANLVLLEVTNEMPAHRTGQQRDLHARFLDPAFAEDRLAGIEGGAHLLRVLFFRDRNELNVVGRSAGFCGGSYDVCADAVELRRDLVHLAVEETSCSLCQPCGRCRRLSTARIALC